MLLREPPGSAPCSASNAVLTIANASSARSSTARSWVAITLVRSSAPAGGTAGCRATLTYTPASYSARQRTTAFQSSPTTTGTIGVVIRRADVEHLEAERAQALAQVARVVEHAREQRRALVRARTIRSAASAAPTAAGTAAAVNRNARELMRRKSITSCEPAMKPPQLASDFENVPIRRSTSASTPNSSLAPAPRAPSTPAACASSTISRAPCALHSSTIRGRSATSPSIEKTPSTTTSTPPPSSPGALEHLLELVEPPVAERAQLGAREQAAVEDRGVVGGVGDHRVAGRQQRAERADVGLVAGGEDDRLLGAHPLRQLALELEVQLDRAVQQPRAGQARAVALERVARAGDHALVAGQAEVVVGAEHHPLGALHRHHRRGGRLQAAEVGQQVGLAGGAQLLGALVTADLRENVDGGRHIGCGLVSIEVRPVRGRRDLRKFIDLPYRLHSTSPVWVPPLRIERWIFLSRRLNAFFKHGDAQLFLAERDGRVVGRISAHYDRARSTTTTTTAGACSASSSWRTTRTCCRRCWTPPRAG